jgi:hypothetical protein
VKRESKVAAATIVAGLVVYQVATLLHESGPDLNDNEAIFRKYADSSGWVTVHLLQLAGILLVLGALMVLFRAWQGRRSAILAAGARDRSRRGVGGPGRGAPGCRRGSAQAGCR